jgi:hypothetical protein
MAPEFRQLSKTGIRTRMRCLVSEPRLWKRAAEVIRATIQSFQRCKKRPRGNQGRTDEPMAWESSGATKTMILGFLCFTFLFIIGLKNA